MYEAYLLAQDSPDPSTQNGAVLVSFGPNGEATIIGKACNTFPRGVQSTIERLERPLKYQFVEHAERGAIYDAAQHGYCTEGTTMFVPWYACSDCARAIICAGIKKVVGHKPMMEQTPQHWKESIANAFTMFQEAGVITEFYEGKVGDIQTLFNGQVWRP
jgi:dCMP deaminase